MDQISHEEDREDTGVRKILEIIKKEGHDLKELEKSLFERFRKIQKVGLSGEPVRLSRKLIHALGSITVIVLFFALDCDPVNSGAVLCACSIAFFFADTLRFWLSPVLQKFKNERIRKIGRNIKQLEIKIYQSVAEADELKGEFIRGANYMYGLSLSYLILFHFMNAGTITRLQFEIFFIILTAMLGWGDSAASLTGTYLGNKRVSEKWFPNIKKTRVGSGTCFAVCFVLAFLGLMVYGRCTGMITWLGALTTSFFVSFTTTSAELVKFKIKIRNYAFTVDDNIVMPIVSSLSFVLMVHKNIL